jgi:hypothetical protein
VIAAQEVVFAAMRRFFSETERDVKDSSDSNDRKASR